MNKLIGPLLVIVLSTTLAVKTDANPIQSALAGMALVEKIEQLYQKNTKNENQEKKKEKEKKKKDSKKTGK